MNIILLHDFDPLKEYVWGTPKGVRVQLEKEGHAVVSHPSFPNPQNKPGSRNCDLSTIVANDYDLMLVMQCGPSVVMNRQLELLHNNSNLKIFLELADEPQCYEHNQGRIDHVDAMFTPDLRCYKAYVSRGYNCHFMTHWCDDSIFYYDESIQRENRCVTTCCVVSEELSHAFGEQFVAKRGLNNEENTQLYNSGTIVFQCARHDEITRRIMEGGGCKNAVITNRISAETGIYDMFLEDEDICYYSNMSELTAKLTKLLNDDDYRNKLSNNIYNKIQTDHLVKHRTKQILDEFDRQTKE